MVVRRIPVHLLAATAWLLATAGCTHDSQKASELPAATAASLTGLHAELKVVGQSGRHADLELVIADDHGGGPYAMVDWGDGQQTPMPVRPVAACPASTAGRKAPGLSKRFPYGHDYASPGTFHVTATVWSEEQCTSSPLEQVTTAIELRVD